MRHVVVAIILAAGPFAVGASLAVADGAGDPTAVKNEGGKYYDKEGNPTFKVKSDGTVDWGTYSGFRRYHSDCHVCHGPDGEGSTYAPALSDYLKTKNYSDFANVVVNGRKNVNTAQESVMPSFGGSDLIGKFSLLAKIPLDPLHHFAAFVIESLEQSRKYQFCLFLPLRFSARDNI